MTRSRARRADAAVDEPQVMAAPPLPLTVAVTGAAGSLGDHVVRALAADPAIGAVVAIDSSATSMRASAARPIDLSTPMRASIAWRTADVRHPSFAHALDRVDVVVHTAIAQDPEARAVDRRAGNLEGVRTVLAAAATAKVRRVVVLSSAMVYGARPDNPPLLREGDPTRAADDDSVVGDFVRIEELAADFAKEHVDIAVVVLRAATIVGPGCDSVVTRHLESPRQIGIRGVPARWQFVHVADVASACAIAVTGAVDGIVNVASPTTLAQADLERITGGHRVELPASVVFGAADRLQRAGVTMAPAGELAYLAYPWIVDSARLLEAGWRPAHDSAAALRAQVLAARPTDGVRRRGRDDATRAAAGATVALLGTAAILRRAKRRRT
jgi:nucleoside-diphosphate-sugar epimerase